MDDWNDDGPGRLTPDEFLRATDPFALFSAWFEAAAAAEPQDPNAMALATVDDTGTPDVRMVLLKGLETESFVFYTNFESDKGRQLLAAPVAALCFHWKSLRRQVRVRGSVSIVGAAEADAYFASRHRLSRIGAWASAQSRPYADKSELVEAVAAMRARFGEAEIPRPPHWSGFRVLPSEIEFWQDGPYRLHDRLRFRRDPGDAWTKTYLYP